MSLSARYRLPATCRGGLMLRWPLMASLCFALWGCGSALMASTSTATPDPAQTTPLPELAGSQWRVSLLGGTAPPAGIVPTVQFASQTQMGGNGGCNGFGSALDIRGDRFRLGPIASTRKLCEPPVMAVERGFFAALDQVRQARIVQGRLELLDDAGVVLVVMVRVG